MQAQHCKACTAPVLGRARHLGCCLSPLLPQKSRGEPGRGGVCPVAAARVAPAPPLRVSRPCACAGSARPPPGEGSAQALPLRRVERDRDGRLTEPLSRELLRERRRRRRSRRWRAGGGPRDGAVATAEAALEGRPVRVGPGRRRGPSGGAAPRPPALCGESRVRVRVRVEGGQRRAAYPPPLSSPPPRCGTGKALPGRAPAPLPTVGLAGVTGRGRTVWAPAAGGPRCCGLGPWGVLPLPAVLCRSRLSTVSAPRGCGPAPRRAPTFPGCWALPRAGSAEQRGGGWSKVLGCRGVICQARFPDCPYSSVLGSPRRVLVMGHFPLRRAVLAGGSSWALFVIFPGRVP